MHGAIDFPCTKWDGTIWELGVGPMPITDTHPNCRCTREVYLQDREFDTKTSTSPTDQIITNPVRGQNIVTGDVVLQTQFFKTFREKQKQQREKLNEKRKQDRQERRQETTDQRKQRRSGLLAKLGLVTEPNPVEFD